MFLITNSHLMTHVINKNDLKKITITKDQSFYWPI